jgi:ribbon-helix-helix CopG family protein
MADKPRGHPPLVDGDGTTPVTIRVPTRLYERVCRRAEEERLKVSEALRRAVRRYVGEPEEE